MYDLMIIGGGPAGMTAAVYAARKKVKALLVSEDMGGQTNWTTEVENYMGYQLIEGPELVQKFEDQVRQFPLDVKIGERIAALSARAGGFEAASVNGTTYQARAAIVPPASDRGP